MQHAWFFSLLSEFLSDSYQLVPAASAVARLLLFVGLLSDCSEDS